jgi:hypothetical protein
MTALSAKVRPIKAEDPEMHYGVPVLDLRVGDAIPTPRAPERYAIRVYPDLARYLLTFNHERQRSIRKRSLERISSDMRDGLWGFTPEALIFTRTPLLVNGQHRLTAVCEHGSEVWMMGDFGWYEGIINYLDRGNARTNRDAFDIEGLPNSSAVASGISAVARYEAVVGLTRGFSGLTTPTTQRSLAIYNADIEGWTRAEHAAARIYRALDKGLGVATWIAAYRICAEVHPEEAATFFDAIASGTDPAGSITRVVGDWFRRRSMQATKTGDSREPLEVIIRAFNAYVRGAGTFAFPKAPGFVLSRVR